MEVRLADSLSKCLEPLSSTRRVHVICCCVYKQAAACVLLMLRLNTLARAYLVGKNLHCGVIGHVGVVQAVVGACWSTAYTVRIAASASCQEVDSLVGKQAVSLLHLSACLQQMLQAKRCVHLLRPQNDQTPHSLLHAAP